MCFNKTWSLFFAGFGFASAFYVWRRTRNVPLAAGIAYFGLMEFLQFFQYLVINECSNPVNKFLTVLGFLHICYQPLFTHLIANSVEANPAYRERYAILFKLCFLGGTMLFARWFLAEYFSGYFPKVIASSDFTIFQNDTASLSLPRETEWLRGVSLCTFKGQSHLAWSIPLVDVSYYVPALSLHSFLMFGPFFVLGDFELALQGLLLMITGPVLASWITPNLMEQGAIWCFFSITQISLMLLILFQVSPELLNFVPLKIKIK